MAAHPRDSPKTWDMTTLSCSIFLQQAQDTGRHEPPTFSSSSFIILFARPHLSSTSPLPGFLNESFHTMKETNPYWEEGAKRRGRIVLINKLLMFRIPNWRYFLISSTILQSYPDSYYFTHLTDKETEVRKQLRVNVVFWPTAALFAF